MRFLLALFLSSITAFAVLPAGAVIEIRTTGFANNGGGFNAARGGTDYSQQDAAELTQTDGEASGTTTFTSAAGGFTDAMKGNYLHIVTSSGLSRQIREIVSVTDGNNVVLDESPGTGTATTFNVGGAWEIDTALDDELFETLVAGNKAWIKSGSYTAAETISIGTAVGTATSMIIVEGYNSTRGDLQGTTANHPILIFGASTSFTPNQFFWFRNITFTGTGASLVVSVSNVRYYNCDFLQTSTVAGRTAVSVGSNNSLEWCRSTSQNGIAYGGTPSSAYFLGSLAAHSDIGWSIAGATGTILDHIIAMNCKTAAISGTGPAQTKVLFCTLANAVATPLGKGIRFTTSGAQVDVRNSIIYGFETGIENAALQASLVEDWNDFSNNTTNRTFVNAGTNSITTAPSFAGFTQITFSNGTATPAGNVITSSGADFSSVTDNVDYARVVSGSGSGTATVTPGNYLITAHTSDTLTVNNAVMSSGTGTGSSIVAVVYTGHNLSPSGTMVGFPGAIGTESTGYPKMGAIQPQAAAGGETSHTFIGP